VARDVSAAAGEPLGSAAEEAARLVESLHDWFGGPSSVPRTAAPGGPAAPAATHGADDAHAAVDSGAGPQPPPDPTHHGPACRSCPLCRGIAAVQASHPEVLGHLAGAAQHLVAALRSLAAEPAPAGPGPAGGAPSTGAPASTGEPPGRPSRAVPIDVDPEPERDAPDRGPSEQEQRT
jgi:hypothetical protein